MNRFTRACDAENYFKKILSSIRDQKITAVFSKSAPFWSISNSNRRYVSDDDIVILLENNMCFVINYLFIDCCHIEFRKITPEENARQNTHIKDLFNTTSTIYKNFYSDEIEERSSISLDYDTIKEIKCSRITYPYGKWIASDIKTVYPKKETFDKIEFIMSNGKSIFLCPESADYDGYIDIWSNDAIITFY